MFTEKENALRALVLSNDKKYIKSLYLVTSNGFKRRPERTDKTIDMSDLSGFLNILP